MLARSFKSPYALRLQQPFHSSAIRQSPRQNHYETLQVKVGASPSDVKKAFYNLSKTYHPDRNPGNPDATKHFVKISAAYDVLGTPAKRQQYDREVIDVTQSGSTQKDQQHRGSYHSSGPAGGRPASGLSRRRTQFRGPPPSFFKNGGWGQQEDRKQTSQESHAPPSGTPNYGTTAGGMGTGQAPFGHSSDVPHFDRESHFRTHEIYDQRRQQRASGNRAPVQDSTGMWGNFFMISIVISLGVIIPSLVVEGIFQRKREK